MIDIPVVVKEALKDGRHKKNYIIEVLNDDGTTDFTIDNNNLVQESVTIDERMDSGDDIKFGLCEGSSLEFQYFDKPNITGRRVNVQLEIEYGDNAWHLIPMGYFDVQKCSRQASTGILKVTAYNKLMSDYLDAKANSMLVEAYYNQDDNTPSTIGKLLNMLLGDYTINADVEVETEFRVSDSKYHDDIGIFEGDVPPSGTGVSIENYLHLLDFKVHVAIPIDTFNYRIKVLPQILDASVSELLGDYSQWRVATDNYITVSKWMHTYYPFPSIYECKAGQWSFQDFKDVNHYYWVGQFYDDESDEWSDYTSPYYYYFNSRFESQNQGDSSDHYEIEFYIPVACVVNHNTYEDWNLTAAERERLNIKAINLVRQALVGVFRIPASEVSNMTVGSEIEQWPDVTLRELQSAVYETECQYGQLDRVTDLFYGVELNRSRLYPAEDLYPDNQLYPGGSVMSTNKMMYSQLWADDGNVHKWRYLIITYKGLDEEGNEKDYTLQRTVNNDGTDNYNCSDNWLFRNLVWTAEQIGEYADAMVAKMTGITWFPFEMWLPGLPYIETGDEIEVTVNENTYPTYVLQRQLKGIQDLQDTYINGTLDIF